MLVLIGGSPLQAVPLYFPGQVTVPVAAPTASAVSLDVTGDGRLDLVAGLANGTVVLLQAVGEGRFYQLFTFVGLDGGRVEDLGLVRLRPGEPEVLVVLTADPDRVVLLDHSPLNPYLRWRATVDLDEDPAGLGLGLAGTDGAAQIAVTLPGSDQWLLLDEQDGVWGVRQEVLTGDRPLDLTVLDLDGDAAPEVVTADNGALSRGLSLHRRGPDGLFDVYAHVPTDGAPVALFPFDVTGDARAELFVGFGDSARVDCFAAVAGVLNRVAVIPSPLPSSGVHVARYLSGEIGLWSWSETRGVVSYFRNSGGGWDFSETFYAGGLAVDAKLADLNEDQWPDLLVANGASGNLGLLFGNNVRSFRAYLAEPLPVQPSSGRLLDEDGDGFLDYLVTCFGSRTIEILRGDGRGHLLADPAPVRLGEAPLALALLPREVGAAPDLAVGLPGSDAVAVLRRGPGGAYTEIHRVGTGDFPAKLVVGDLDADGFLDLITGNLLSQNLTLAFGLGDGTFEDVHEIQPWAAIEDILLLDLDGDALPEIVASDGRAVVYTLRNLGDRTFSSPNVYSITGEPATLAGADLDGDGDKDLSVARRANQALAFYENLGNGFLRSRVTEWPLGGRPGGVTTADVDLDGLFDVVVTLVDQQEVAVVLNRGGWTFTPPIKWVSALVPAALGVGDLNGDLVPDFALLDQSLALALTMLNVEPNPVPVAEPQISLSCTGSALEIRFTPPTGMGWTVEGASNGAWIALARDGQALHGTLVRSGEGWLLRLSESDCAGVGLGADGGLLAVRLDTGPPGSAPQLASAGPGCLDVAGGGPASPLVLLAPRPNPFNPRVECRFRLARPAEVQAVVHDAAGRRVAVLARRWFAAGEHAVFWDGRGARGPAGAGTYVVTISADGRAVSRKLTLAK